MLPSPERTEELPADGAVAALSFDDAGHGSGNSFPDTKDDESTLQEADLVDQTLYLPTKKIILAVIAIALAFFVAIIEQTLIALAVPAIASDFRAGSKISWVITAFLLGSSGVSPFIGRFSDIFSRKVVLLTSMAIFFWSTLACAFAGSIEQLIVFRAVQGIGSSGISSSGFIILADLVPLNRRGKYQGIIDSICGIGQATGPIFGAVLVDKLDWRACFWILLPIVAIDSLLLWWLVPAVKMAGDWKAKLAAIDYVGCVLALAGTTLLLVGILRGGIEVPWSDASTIVPMIIAMLCFIAFALWEVKGARIPVVPLRLFCIPTVAGVHLATLASQAAAFVILYDMPVWLQVVRGLPIVISGAAILPYGTGLSLVVCLSVLCANKTGLRPLILLGFTLWSVMAGLLTRFDDGTSVGEICGIMSIGAVGAGLTIVTTLMICQAAVSRANIAVVTGSRMYARQLGSAIGIAVAASCVSNGVKNRLTKFGLDDGLIKDVLHDPASIQHSLKFTLDASLTRVIVHAYVASYRTVFWVIFGLLAFSLAISAATMKEYPLVREDDEGAKEAERAGSEEQKSSTTIQIGKVNGKEAAEP